MEDTESTKAPKRFKKAIAFLGILFILIVLGSILFSGSKKSQEGPKQTIEVMDPTKEQNAFSSSTGKKDEFQASIRDLQAENSSLKQKLESLERFQQKASSDLENYKRDINPEKEQARLNDMETRLSKRLESSLQEQIKVESSKLTAGPNEQGLTERMLNPEESPKGIYDFSMDDGDAGPKSSMEPAEKRQRRKRIAFLPVGAHVKGTLLTGCFAPMKPKKPLPVLIEVEEAFTGPNGTQIPLAKGYLIAAAQADLVSQRAIIQVTHLSAYVNGEYVSEYSKDGNQLSLGYVVGPDLQVGVPGKLIRLDAKILGSKLFWDTASGFANAMARNQVTSLYGSGDNVKEFVSGNAMKYSAYSGAGQASKEESDRQSKIIENEFPAIEIKAGVPVEIIMLQEVPIEALVKAY